MRFFLINTSNTSITYLIGAIVAFLVFYWIIYFVLQKFGKDPNSLLPKGAIKKVAAPLFLIFLSVLIRMRSLRELLGLDAYDYVLDKTSTLLFIFAFTWLVLGLLKLAKEIVISKYDIQKIDNLKARKIYTQFNILERIAIFIVVILAIGMALMTFDGIREVGISVFASAGVAGIIIGFSAQKLIATILAGIQIAIAQPIKIDDVVIVEGEWGRIEEISLTYVVVKIWDKRRLIVPTTYFIEKPFENWTKTSAELLGTVFLYVDYRVPIDAIRQELAHTLENTGLWDGQVNVLQVTDSTAHYVQLRALMSAKDSPTAWDLRVYVREKLITFLQENYPDSIAHQRVLLKEDKL